MGEELSINEAKTRVREGLGKYWLELVTSFCAPLYWVVQSHSGNILTRNGTAFFLNPGEGIFGVTACHVIEGWHASIGKESTGPLRLGGNGSSIQLDWHARVIDANSEIDIATFSITKAEIEQLGKTVLTGSQRTWPPGPPQEKRGICYCGYPSIGTQHISKREVSFGAVPASGIATSVSDKDVSTLIEREYLIPVLGGGILPENFDFGGISGGPMLTVVESGLSSWALAGVIYQGPNTSENSNEAITGLEVIKARRAHFILPNGKLDTARWYSVAS